MCLCGMTRSRHCTRNHASRQSILGPVLGPELELELELELGLNRPQYLRSLLSPAQAVWCRRQA